MAKFVPSHHGNHAIVSYTKNKGVGVLRCLLWKQMRKWGASMDLTSEEVSISGKQVEKSGIKDAGVNTR